MSQCELVSLAYIPDRYPSRLIGWECLLNDKRLLQLYVSVFVSNLGLGMYMYFIPVFAQSLGATFFDLGVIGSAVAVTSALTPMFVGYLADKMNRAWLFSSALVINAVATLALVFSRSTSTIVVLRLLGGLGLGFYYPTVEVLITDMAPPQRRVKAMAWYSAASTSGLLVGPILGGFVVQETSFVELFVLSSLVITVASVQVAMWIAPNYKRRRSVVSDFSGIVHTMRRLLPWYLMIACYGIVYSVITTIFPGYANSVGIGTTLIGLLFAAFGLSRIFVYVTSERYVKLGEKRAVLGASLLIALAIVGVGVLSRFTWFLFGFLIIGGCSGIIFPITISLISRHFPDEKLGAAVGSYEATVGIGQAMGPILVGSVTSFAGVEVGFLLTAFCGVLMAVFASAGRTYTAS